MRVFFFLISSVVRRKVLKRKDFSSSSSSFKIIQPKRHTPRTHIIITNNNYLK